MKSSKFFTTVLTVLFCFHSGVFVSADTITVGPGGSGAGYDYATIQEGINAAVNGDEVVIAESTYTGTGNKNISFYGKAITVRSTDPEDSAVVAATVIDCENSGRAFIFNSEEGYDSVIAGLTITNGYTNAYGASGAGIFCNLYSRFTIINCLILNCRANLSSGGGIDANKGIIITNCDFRNNSALSGGALGLYNCNATLKNCTFSDNVAFPTLERGGGAISCINNSNMTLTNCIFSNNSTDRNGGAIFYYIGSTSTFSNCIFVGNSAPNGNSICCYYDAFSFPNNLELTNCILWGSTDEIANDDSSTITINFSDVQGGWSGTGNINDDPLFVSGRYGDYYLSQTSAGQGDNSPCVDSGWTKLQHEPTK
ncbi:MAG: right-handed parallel beta-helix repeat-containing protein [Planctomycetota bacterium]|jgi:hypothetical protein